MSRIGKKIILLPQGVEAKADARVVTVTGPKGTLSVPLPPHTRVAIDAEQRSLSVSVELQDDTKQRALWGLCRQLLANAVSGVQKPFQKSLEFVGVGFKLALVGTRTLNFEVGFSHPVTFEVPEGISATVEKQVLTLSGIDKQLVGEVAAQIRRIRPPEPYKGKGIKYSTEVIQRKAGKAATKSAA